MLYRKGDMVSPLSTVYDRYSPGLLRAEPGDVGEVVKTVTTDAGVEVVHVVFGPMVAVLNVRAVRLSCPSS